ncbi:hypothetical protein [Palleronia sp.]|uniref:hypothetical protein n=1 Tax=Palleronia sp. TaxID=1940284 RepID=UPI0035C80BA8
MKIELKSIKYAAFSSEETSCYSATLYVNSKKIGTVSNDGHGGPDRFYGDHAAFAAADAWCKANLPRWQMNDQSFETDLEMRCGQLVDEWLVARDLKTALRTKVLLRDTDGLIYQVRHRGHVSATVEAVKERHPGAAILNTLPFEEALKLYRSAASS